MRLKRLFWRLGKVKEARAMTEPVDDQALLIQLHGLLNEIDPVRWHVDAALALKLRLRELQRRLEQREPLQALAGELQLNLNQLEAPETELRARLLELKKRLVPAYESIAARFRAQKIHVPSLRPTNWARSAFHVASAVVALVAIELLPFSNLIAIAATWAAFAWACEIGRRSSPAINALLMRVFRPVAHEHETYRINSATWYATALLLLSLLRSPVIGVVAISILGVGDPLAGLIGRKFGRIKLMHGRSLEGTSSFFLGGTAVAFGLLVAFHSSVTTGEALIISATAALFGALAELLSLRLDDNLSVPLAAAAGAALAMHLV